MSFSILLLKAIILWSSQMLFYFYPFPTRLVHKESGGVTVPLSSNCTVKQRRHCCGCEQGIKTTLHDKELETDFETLFNDIHKRGTR